MTYYLYTCYCGPQKTRLQAERPSTGYIYENCPALTAPPIEAKTLDDLKDFRAPILKEKLEKVINVFRSHGCTKADLIGSFVQNQTNSHSDIDFATDIPVEDRNRAALISRELTDIIGHSCDVTPYFFLFSFPHSTYERARIGLFDDGRFGV